MITNDTKTRVILAFKEALDAGESKENILQSMIDAGCKISDVSQQYKELARTSGLVLTTEQRKAKADDIFDEANLCDSKKVAEALQKVTAELEVSMFTAKKYLKDFAKSTGLNIAKAKRVPNVKVTAVIEYVLAEHNKRTPRAEIIKALEEDFEYTPSTASSKYQQILRENNLIIDRNELQGAMFDWLVDNPDTGEKRFLAHAKDIRASKHGAKKSWEVFQLAVELAPRL